ncbi:hypothetical protein KKF91_09545 [Myxococcota bacterium]|nr:hypothetical protein [Myxococcota bacterium]MBU1430785.1 hypothetical protein [Myxococcota bacterium]
MVDVQTQRFRERVYADRQGLVNRLRGETYDEGYVLYPAAEGEADLIIKDAFQEQISEPIEAFMTRLSAQWWAHRQRRQGVAARSAFYCRYLPEVGFDWMVEFGEEGAICCWRRDQRQRAWRLALPEDEGMFHDQLGAFFNARAGWRWLLSAYRAEAEALTVSEIQPGYVIGARRGVPGDLHPEAREDPDLEIAFSRWDTTHYDTLEFLGGGAAEGYPFHEERYDAWIGAEAEAIERGEVEIFVLAESRRFVEAVEELACGRAIGIDWIDIDDDPHAELYHGPLRLTMHFAYAYLRTIHTGLSFPEGARRFYGPVIDQLEDAGDLLDVARRRLEGYDIQVEARQVLVIRQSPNDPPLGRWGLMSLAGSHAFRGQEGEDAFLRFLGFDPEAGRFTAQRPALDRCPITGQPARLTKLIRPKALLGFDYKLLAGVDLGEHFVYYALEGETHTIPLHADQPLEALETAYQAQLPTARAHLQAVIEVGAALLFIGPDVGSLILEPGRVRALRRGEEVRGEGERGERGVAYAFFSDALLLSLSPLTRPAREAARMRAFEAVLKYAPRRLWAIDRAEIIDLRGPSIGEVVWPQ